MVGQRHGDIQNRQRQEARWSGGEIATCDAPIYLLLFFDDRSPTPPPLPPTCVAYSVSCDLLGGN